LSACYESNFGAAGDEGTRGGLVGTAKGVESVVVSCVYSRLVSRLIDRSELPL
jgi:hypothetical protein